jgi:hypothetical protein
LTRPRHAFSISPVSIRQAIAAMSAAAAMLVLT